MKLLKESDEVASYLSLEAFIWFNRHSKRKNNVNKIPYFCRNSGTQELCLNKRQVFEKMPVSHKRKKKTLNVCLKKKDSRESGKT